MRCSGAVTVSGRVARRAFGDMPAIHPSPSIRSFFLSFLHDYGDEASDHDEALEEVGPHHGPQPALQREHRG